MKAIAISQDSEHIFGAAIFDYKSWSSEQANTKVIAEGHCLAS